MKFRCFGKIRLFTLSKSENTCHQKKVLALVLAFACAFTMFAGAAFNDASDIQTGDAVDTLVALGVINGFEDGSFRPDGTVTRAEMAKMIYVIRTGRSDASAYNNDPTTFTDVDGHWGAGYIKYAQALGIIAGKSATRFYPDETVTTVEAAKMLLVTLGYNAEVAELVGANWIRKTIALADENGLLKDVLTGSNSALPRQYAAQMMYNAIFAPTVVLRDGEYTNMKVITSSVAGVNNYNPTIGEKYMGLKETNGRLIDVSLDTDKNEYTYTIWGDDANNDSKVDSNETLTYKSEKDFTDMFAMNVKVMYKTENNDTTVYGLSAVDSSVVASGVVGDIDAPSASAKEVKIDGTKYKLSGQADATPIYNYLAIAPASGNPLTSSANLDDIATAVTNKATSFELIDINDDDKGDFIVVHPFTVSKVTYVGTKSVSAGTSYTFEDNNIYDGIAKDDYAVIYAAANTVDDTDTLVKAEVVSGKVSGSKGSAGAYTDIQIDGTWYHVQTSTIAANMDSTYDFAVVNGYIFASDVTAESSKDILFLSEREKLDKKFSTTGTVEAKVFIDGKDQIIKISKLNDKELAAVGDVGTKYVDEATLTAGLYTYTVNNDGEYSVKALNNSNNKAGYDSYKTGVKFLNATDVLTGGLRIADDAVVYVQKADKLGEGAKVEDASYITGKKLKNWSNDYGDLLAQALVTKTNGIEYAKVIALVDSTNSVETVASELKYGYVIKDKNDGPYAGKNENGDDVTWLTLWTGAEEITVYTKDSNTLAAGDAIAYKEGNDASEITAITELTNKVAITGIEEQSEGAVIFEHHDSGTTTEYDWTQDEDIVVIGIDSANKVGGEMTIKNIVGAQSKTDGKLTLNAIVAVDDNSDINNLSAASKKITAIFADVANELDGEADITSAEQQAKNAQSKIDAMATALNGSKTTPKSVNASGGALTGANSETVDTADILTDTDLSYAVSLAGGVTGVEDQANAATVATNGQKIRLTEASGAGFTGDQSKIGVELTISSTVAGTTAKTVYLLIAVTSA